MTDDTRHTPDTEFDLRSHLLDRQIVDRDGFPVGIVDDVEFELPGETGDPPAITALLTGRALVDRIFGDVPEPSRLTAISAGLVESVGVVVRLSAGRDSLRDLLWFERWARDHIVSRIPGSGRRG